MAIVGNLENIEEKIFKITTDSTLIQQQIYMVKAKAPFFVLFLPNIQC